MLNHAGHEVSGIKKNKAAPNRTSAAGRQVELLQNDGTIHGSSAASHMRPNVTSRHAQDRVSHSRTAEVISFTTSPHSFSTGSGLVTKHVRVELDSTVNLALAQHSHSP